MFQYDLARMNAEAQSVNETRVALEGSAKATEASLEVTEAAAKVERMRQLAEVFTAAQFKATAVLQTAAAKVDTKKH